LASSYKTKSLADAAEARKITADKTICMVGNRVPMTLVKKESWLWNKRLKRTDVIDLPFGSDKRAIGTGLIYSETWLPINLLAQNPIRIWKVP
jgi:hypothetical protein